MRFIDEVLIRVKAGQGGNGCASFRREKFIPKGGPDGGDGGRGASIFFEASKDVQTLLDFRYQRDYSAPNGENGRGAQCYGKGGEDLTLKVPMGTRLRSTCGQIDIDLVNDQQRVLVARGGKGGLGNLHFKSSTNQSPRQHTLGEEGESFDLKLELKLLSHVGLVGVPNAGKSTLLNAITSAKSKTGDYPFTTLAPVLGVLNFPSENVTPLIVADIPGLVEGAHEGRGLGIQFLKHISRSFSLLFVIALEPNRSLFKDFGVLCDEIKAFDPELLERSRIVAINKIDRLDDESFSDEQRDLWRGEVDEFLKRVPHSLAISASHQTGLVNLVESLAPFKNPLQLAS